jgi:hypothetical protein
MSVTRAQQEIDSAEFTEWLAYYQLEPFGEKREDHRAGTIAAMISAAHGVSASPADFFENDVARLQQTPAQMQNILWAFAEAQNS